MEIPIVRNTLEKSHLLGRENRETFDRSRVFAVNLMSSPGSGKTALLMKTIPILQMLGINCAVIQGDIASSLDREKLRQLNIPIAQVNTESCGGACYIAPQLVKVALEQLDLSTIQILFIENSGNTVSPAELYLGEDCKIVVLSITEGEDKPLKYPMMFRQSQICIISKMDLLPYLDFDLSILESNIRTINSQLEIIFSSARTGEGIATLVDWLTRRIAVASGCK